jgi:outer membrane protein assembly factor BamA
LSNEQIVAPVSQSIVIDLLGDNNFQEVDRLFTFTEIFVKKINFISDVFFQQDEFHYLVGISENSWVKPEDLKKALRYLKLKNKFSIIKLELLPVDQGFVLYFDLEGTWTFQRVKFYGAVLGKDKYRQYYSLEPTERFDIKKHRDCLEKIKEVFVHEGYFDATLVDTLHYNTKTKSVTVNIVFDPGICYVINRIELKVYDNYSCLADESELITKKIKKNFGTTLHGVLFSQAKIDKHIQYLKEYLAKKGFFNAKIDLHQNMDHAHKSVDLVFDIYLQQRKKITFFGNYFFSKNDLFEQILVFGNSLYLLPPSIIAEELVTAYKKKGFWSISIDARQKGSEYFFVIKEGPRSGVYQVTLQGVNFFNPQELAKRFFYSFSRQKYFDAEALKQALKQITNFYVQEGFWDFSILKQEYKLLPNKEGFHLVLTVDEGPRRLLRSLTVKNFPELVGQGPLQKIVPNAQPKPFDLKLIYEQRQWLIRHFQEQGYLYVEVKPEVLEGDYCIDLIWHVHMQESKVSFGKVIVTGSNTFPFRHLMYRMEYREGMPWNKKKLEDSLMSIRNLNCFETLYLYPHNIAVPEVEKPIIVKLIEDDPFEARLRVGFQQVSRYFSFRNGSTYRLGGSFLYKNPTNVGDYFYVNSDVTKYYRYFSGMYFRPWSMYNPINLIFKGYANKYTQPVIIGSNKTLYNARQEGFLVGLSRPFKIVDFGLNVGFEVMETSGLSIQLAKAINFEPKLVDKGVPYFYAEPSIFIDGLDNKINPTKGTLTVLSAKGMFSWHSGAVTFFKMLAEQSFFAPLDPMVLGVRVRFGHIFNQKFSSIMPPERFFLGGANSLRGYEPDYAPPLGIYIEENGKRRLVPQGGKSMFNANIEMRFWVTKNFGGTIFQDFGVLSTTSMSDVTAGSLLAATGFGLRYETPIGPLRFDLGFKWRREELEDSSIAWFLTFGNAF